MIKKIFTWWNGATIGALFDINRRAKKVGEDEYGNSYYEEPLATIEGRKRRYVIYNGYAEASKVPVDWHGWLHYTFDNTPIEEPFKLKEFEKPHRPNLTGTIFASRPKNSIANISKENNAKTGLGYDSWTPSE